MFGYVIANSGKLSPEGKLRYRACYCGLCKAIGTRHGAISRITLNYDMTFLVLFLSSLYEEKSVSGEERCFVHPFGAHAYWRNDITDYAADMNMALAYFKFRDDWEDERKALSLFEAELFKRECERVTASYPRQCSVIRARLSDLSDIEKAGDLNPDIPANCFGELMGEVFALREGPFFERAKAFGRSLGKFIYIMDACLDLRRDVARERYNPMVATSSDSFEAILNVLMADCAEDYKKLPIEQDKQLIENILYSGVWTRYEARDKKVKASAMR
jgi:hypothetical protein